MIAAEAGKGAADCTPCRQQMELSGLLTRARAAGQPLLDFAEQTGEKEKTRNMLRELAALDDLVETTSID